MWAVLITASARIGEALGLQWTDVDLDAKKIEIWRAIQRQREKALVFVEPESSSSRRVIELSEFAVRALRDHRVRQVERRLLLGLSWIESNTVFTSDICTPIDPRNVLRRLRQGLEENGLPRVRIHDLRHTVATLHLQQGRRPRAVQAMLGHGPGALTMNTYSHITPMMQRDPLTARTQPSLEAGDRLLKAHSGVSGLERVKAVVGGADVNDSIHY